MRKLLPFLLLLVLMVSAMAWGITGSPIGSVESLDVTTTAVCTITSTTYKDSGSSRIYPVLIQTHGTGYYLFDYFAAVTDSDYTPTATAGYHCIDGDVIEVDNPQWFRIIAAAADFSAVVTAFAP